VVIFAGLVGSAEIDILDHRRIELRALDDRFCHQRGQVIGPE
jgi:hypothetical protein